MRALLLTGLLVIHRTIATTEWFGDKRAHMYPPRAPAFYDVAYDESECPAGLRSEAIPDYVYFGMMLATFSVNAHDECLKRCLEKPRCKSINFFHPLSYQEKGFCELLSETQYDNPRLMRPFRNAIHYENIRCREEDIPDFGEDFTETKGLAASLLSLRMPSKPSAPQKVDLTALLKKLSAKVSEFNKLHSTSFRA